MKPPRSTRSIIFILLLSALILFPLFSPANAGSPTTLLPIGAGYEQNTLSFFALQAIAHDADNTIQIRVLPITYATDAYTITSQERAENLALAQSRASEINTACALVVTPPAICEADVVDIQVRADAQNPVLVNQISTFTDGIFILGGDQTIAMLVTANTLLEDMLETRYLAGVPISGTSAGAAVQSRYMIGGLTGDNSSWDALKLGTIDLWYDALNTDHRGLRFAFENGVFEQHVLERGRLARLLQATEQLPSSHIGIGVDWATGAVFQNENLLLETQGAYAAVVVDQETYGAAAGAAYLTPAQILSIHNVGFHIIPSGGFGYDLTSREPLVNGAPQTAPDLGVRDVGITLPPAGTGPLFVAGDLESDPLGAVSQDFAALAQATGAPTVVFAVGYSNSQAIAAANTWAFRLNQLGVSNVQTAPLNLNNRLTLIANKLSNAGAIFIVGGNQATLAAQIPFLQNTNIPQIILQRWHAGAPVLFDNAAAASVGSWMSNAPTPADVELEGSESFINGHIPIANGFGFLPGVVFEPRFLYDYRYGRLVAHAYAHSGAVGLGIERETALKITPQEIRVIGKMAVMVIDPRFATFLGLGSNNAYAASWLILDTFVTTEQLPAVPVVAEKKSK